MYRLGSRGYNALNQLAPARPNASDALDIEVCELCHALSLLPGLEPELVFRPRERKQTVPPGSHYHCNNELGRRA